MPTNKRRGRVAESIEETLTVLLSQAADERLNLITVTDVEVNQDLSAAKVWITITGGDEEQQAAMAGLKHAEGFLRHEIVETLDLRRAPTMTFHYDKSVARAERVLQIIEQLNSEQADQTSDGPRPDDGAR
jgi:ribosome-binding factor A